MQVMLRVNNAFGEFVGAVSSLEIPGLVAARDLDWRGLKCKIERNFIEVEGEAFYFTNHERCVGKMCWDSVEMHPCHATLLLALLNEAHWEIISVEQAHAAGWIVPIAGEEMELLHGQ